MYFFGEKFREKWLPRTYYRKTAQVNIKILQDNALDQIITSLISDIYKMNKPFKLVTIVR